jgi:S-sulfosulfanyl-L-cysteine sulfohydrolase
MGGWVIKFKGMKIEFNAYGEKGNRVKKATVHDKAIDVAKIYRISACERDGDPSDTICRIKGVANTRDTPFSLHAILKEYLATNSPVTPTLPLSAKVLDAPQTLLTQVHGVDYQFR